jgi:hypothetical protein
MKPEIQPIQDAVAGLVRYLRSIEGAEREQAQKAAAIFEEQAAFLSSDFDRAITWLNYSISAKGIFDRAWSGESFNHLATLAAEVNKTLSRA